MITIRKEVLVIDDEIKPSSKLGKAIKKIEELSDYKVNFFYTGQEALDYIANDSNNSIKGILLDIQFKNQDMEGPEIFNLIKLNKPNLHIMVLTCKEENRGAFEMGGASHYFEKKEFVDSTQPIKKLIEIMDGEFDDPNNNNYTMVVEFKENEPNYCSIDIRNAMHLSVLDKNIFVNSGVAILIRAYVDRYFQTKADILSNVHKLNVDRLFVSRAEIMNNSYDESEIIKRISKINRDINKLSKGKINQNRMSYIFRNRGYRTDASFRIVIGNIISNLHKNSV